VRTLQQELLRNVGIKILPFDVELQEKYAEYQEQRALRTILEEAGEIRSFSVPFVPKKKK